MKCPVCKNEFVPNFRFCLGCGRINPETIGVEFLGGKKE